MTMNREDFRFEICANSVESCIAAQEGGADRVELCAGIPEGGTTPSYGEIKVARRLLSSTRLHVIIRPRGGDFLYSPLEMERMEEDIRMCGELGVDGVVFGCLGLSEFLAIIESFSHSGDNFTLLRILFDGLYPR